MTHSGAATELQELLAGNQRFVAGKGVHPDETRKRRLDVAGEQRPLAVIVGCADSRVPPEIIFDQGLGDLFVVRTAGQVLDNVDVGTVQYATDFLHVPLVMVLGHSDCGAVSAAVAGEKVLGHLADVLTVIRQSTLAVQGEPGDRVTNAVKENTRRTVRQLQSASLIPNTPAGAGKPEIVGAYYDLVTGTVEVLEGIV